MPVGSGAASSDSTFLDIRFSAYSADFSNRTDFEVASKRNTSIISDQLFFTAIVRVDLSAMQGSPYLTTEDPSLLWRSINEHIHTFSPCLPYGDAIELTVDATAWYKGTPALEDGFLNDVLGALAAMNDDGPKQIPAFRLAPFMYPCGSEYKWRLESLSRKPTTLYFDHFTVWDPKASFEDVFKQRSELHSLFSLCSTCQYCFTNTVWALSSCSGFDEVGTLDSMLCCNATACSWKPTVVPQSRPLQMEGCIDVAYVESKLGTKSHADSPRNVDFAWLITAVVCLVLLLLGLAVILVRRRRAAAKQKAGAAAHPACGGAPPCMRAAATFVPAPKSRGGDSESAATVGTRALCESSAVQLSSFVSPRKGNVEDGIVTQGTSQLAGTSQLEGTNGSVIQIINNEAFSQEVVDSSSGVERCEYTAPQSGADGMIGSVAAAHDARGSAERRDTSGRLDAAPVIQQHAPPRPVGDDAAETSSSGVDSDPLVTFLTELGQTHEDHALTLQGVIGRGTFGIVYQGHWKGLRVAVKRLELQVHPSENIAAHPGLREAKLALQLCHENVVCTYRVSVRKLRSEEAGAAASRPLVGALRIEGELAHSYELFLLQELCDGGPLQIALARGMLHCNGVPQLRSVLRVALDIAQGLYALHRNNIIHGDLKPENVLLSSYVGRAGSVLGLPFIAKLCDFGLSFAVGSGTHVSNMHVGTPIYVAPEVRSNGHLSKAADMYSFGVVLWELFTSFDACVHTVDGVSQHPQLMQWSSPVARQAPVSYVLLTVACLSPDRSTRPSVDRAVSVLADLYDQVNSNLTGGVEHICTFADSVHAFRDATHSSVAPDSQEELAEWLHYLSASAPDPAHEQLAAIAESACGASGRTDSDRSSSQWGASESTGSHTLSTSQCTSMRTLSAPQGAALAPQLRRAGIASADSGLPLRCGAAADATGPELL